MKRIIFVFLTLSFFSGCVATTVAVKDLREYPSYKLGVVQRGWGLDPNWNIDVWVNAQPPYRPSFILAADGRQEWEVGVTDEVSVYAEAWVWEKDKKLVLAKTTKPVRVKISKTRDWSGYGWRVTLQRNDFGLSSWQRRSFYRIR